MNLETKITIYKFTPQVFTLTHELLKMGVKCSDSQLLLLEVGGLIDRTKGKWKLFLTKNRQPL